MANFSLTDAIAISDNKSANDFNTIIDGCLNPSYFTDDNPINMVRSWMGYYSDSPTSISVDLNKTSIGAGGGTVNITYTITGPVDPSGITPDITTDLGEIDNITVSNSDGLGTATLSIPSRGVDYSTTTRSATVSVSWGGVVVSKTVTQAANNREYEYGVVTVSISASPTSIDAFGGTSTLTYSASEQRRYVYDSGSYGEWSSISRTPTISGNATGFSRSGSSVTIDPNTSIEGRSVTYTASYTGIVDSDSDSVTISQNADSIDTVSVKSMTVTAGGITSPSSNYSAAGATKTVSSSSAATCSITLTLGWVSGNTTETSSYSNYGTLAGPAYSWATDQTYATLITDNMSSLSVTMAANKTTSARSATITRTASYTFNAKSVYGGGTTTKTGSCTATINQDKDTIKSITPTLTVGAGSITSPTSNYPASESTQKVNSGGSPSCSVSLSIEWVSGRTTTSSNYTSYDTFYGPNYSWSSNQTYATLTSQNSLSLNVKMTSRGTSYSTSTRSATITRSVKFRYVLNDEYGGAEYSDTKSCTATVTQAANNRSYEYEWDSWSISASPASIGAGGGKSTLTLNGAQTKRYVYDSGSYGSWENCTVTSTISGSATGFSRSGNTVTVSSRGTDPGSARSCTYTVKFTGEDNTTKTDSVTITQELNQVIDVQPIASPTSGTNGKHFQVSKTSFTAAGGTATVSGSGRCTLTFSSGSEYEANGSGEQCGGTLTFSREYSSNVTWMTISGTTVTVDSRGVNYGAARSGTLSSTLTCTFVRTNVTAGTLTGTMNSSYTISQAINQVESLETIGSTSTGKYFTSSVTNFTAAGGTATLTGSVNCKVIFSSGESTITSSQGTKYGGSLTFSRNYTSNQSWATISGTTVTVSSRGSTIGPARSATITSNCTWTFTRTSVGTGSVSDSGSGTGTINQALNECTSVDHTGTPKISYASDIPWDASSSVSVGKSGMSGRFYYTSGSYGDPSGYTSTYKFTSSNTSNIAVNQTTGAISGVSKNVGTSKKSATITCNHTWSYTNPSTVGGKTVSDTATCTTTAYQAYPTATVTLSYTPNVTLGHGVQATITCSTSASSGITVKSYSWTRGSAAEDKSGTFTYSGNKAYYTTPSSGGVGGSPSFTCTVTFSYTTSSGTAATFTRSATIYIPQLI